MGRLGREEIVAMEVLVGQGEKRAAVARRMGVTEGAVRYHLKRAALGRGDGRQGKPMKAACMAEPVDAYMERVKGQPKRRNLKVLYEDLVELGYEGS